MEKDEKQNTTVVKTGTIDASRIVASDGLHLFEQTKEVTLTAEEATLVRKILQCANQMFTVADIDFHENKLDMLIRKLRRYEDG